MINSFFLEWLVNNYPNVIYYAIVPLTPFGMWAWYLEIKEKFKNSNKGEEK